MARLGNSLAVQWLGLLTFTAEGTGSIPGWGTKIPQAVRPGQHPPPPPKQKKQKQQKTNKKTPNDTPESNQGLQRITMGLYLAHPSSVLPIPLNP